ncbi:hypothetical protein GW17_00008686 [Ensete ventricosum]|nr:hypothetical protein GW17_00008686 [Ensete ventricosum]RZS06244.1 hypothetical protein BHM03_00036863 [Ensete ventricosum]
MRALHNRPVETLPPWLLLKVQGLLQIFHCSHPSLVQSRGADPFCSDVRGSRFIVMPTQLPGRSFAKLVSCQLFWCRGLDDSRGGSRPRYGWLGSDLCPSCLLVQSFFLNMRKGNPCRPLSFGMADWGKMSPVT